MRPVDFPGRNAIYEKPESMTDEECYPVPAFRHFDSEGNVVAINTYWMPNKEDIEAILAGRGVVMQTTRPYLVPAALFTCDELGNINE